MKKSTLLSAIFLSMFAASSFSKTIKLYEQPKADAKTIGTIDSEAGIIPIFSSKDGTWIKVGDPRNGEVGWVKSNDFATKGTVGFTFTQKTFNSGKGTEGYMIQFGTPQNVSTEQIQSYFKVLHDRQSTIQRDMQRMMHEMFSSPALNYPIIMPVLFMPYDTAQPPDTTNTNKTTKTSK